MGHNGPVATNDNGSQIADSTVSIDTQTSDQTVGRHFSDDSNATTSVADNYVPRHATKDDNQPNALPQTGQSNDSALTISGIVAIIASLLLGLGNLFKVRKEN